MAWIWYEAQKQPKNFQTFLQAYILQKKDAK